MTTATPTVAAGTQKTDGTPTTTAGRVRKRLNSRTATLVSIVIAVLWTIPTFGLFVSSLRPEDEIKTTGWWTFFTDPQFTLRELPAGPVRRGRRRPGSWPATSSTRW